MASITSCLGIVSFFVPFSAPPSPGYSKWSCTGPEKPVLLHDGKESWEIDHALAYWTPVGNPGVLNTERLVKGIGMDILPFVLLPGEVLKSNPSHLILDQTRARDPAAVATFDGRVTDVIVDSNPSRIEPLEQGSKDPKWAPPTSPGPEWV